MEAFGGDEQGGHCTDLGKLRPALQITLAHNGAGMSMGAPLTSCEDALFTCRLGRSAGALMRARRGELGALAGRTREWISVRGGTLLRSRAASASTSDDGAPEDDGRNPPKHFKGRSHPPGASKYSAPFDDGGTSVSDHDNQWFGGVGGSSVSDADTWGSQSDGSRFRNPVVQHEQRMFDGLKKMEADPDKLKWPTRCTTTRPRPHLTKPGPIPQASWRTPDSTEKSTTKDPRPQSLSS